jgi:hypothetical protein
MIFDNKPLRELTEADIRATRRVGKSAKRQITRDRSTLATCRSGSITSPGKVRHPFGEPCDEFPKLASKCIVPLPHDAE